MWTWTRMHHQPRTRPRKWHFCKVLRRLCGTQWSRHTGGQGNPQAARGCEAENWGNSASENSKRSCGCPSSAMSPRGHHPQGASGHTCRQRGAPTKPQKSSGRPRGSHGQATHLRPGDAWPTTYTQGTNCSHAEEPPAHHGRGNHTYTTTHNTTSALCNHPTTIDRDGHNGTNPANTAHCSKPTGGSRRATDRTATITNTTVLYPPTSPGYRPPSTTFNIWACRCRAACGPRRGCPILGQGDTQGQATRGTNDTSVIIHHQSCSHHRGHRHHHHHHHQHSSYGFGAQAPRAQAPLGFLLLCGFWAQAIFSCQ